MSNQIWYHVDVNSAFLSWTAACEVLINGSDRDLRRIAAVIGGSEKERHGIVLAKSDQAKAFGIRTGESLVEARSRCPGLIVVPPDYELYVNCSRALIRLLEAYCPHVHQYSIDEAFCSMEGTETLWGSPVVFARQLKEEIYKTLGFTVNIGVSDQKLLAKMASEFKKPDRVHTLFQKEIQEKLWPLPVHQLFWVGRATAARLKNLGIRTIGELANTDLEILKAHLKKQGEYIWHYANGRDLSPFLQELSENKGYGNSMTIPFDVRDMSIARQALLSLTETAGARLRADGRKASCISVSITDSGFCRCSRQKTLYQATDVTAELYQQACGVLEALWDGSPIRQMGVHTSCPVSYAPYQYHLFPADKEEAYGRLDAAADAIRNKYGEDALMRAVFLKNPLPHMAGGIDKAKRTGVTKALGHP